MSLTRTKPRQLEAPIVAAICDYLSLRRHLFYRNNNTPIFDPTRQVFRAMPKHTMRGLPDIVVILKGQYVGLEVKPPKGKQSEHQIEFERLLKEAGGRYHVVTSIDEVMKLGL